MDSELINSALEEIGVSQKWLHAGLYFLMGSAIISYLINLHEQQLFTLLSLIKQHIQLECRSETACMSPHVKESEKKFHLFIWICSKM